MAAGEDQLNTACKEGMTSLLRIPYKKLLPFYGLKGQKEGQGKREGVEKLRKWIWSDSAYLRFLNGYLYASTLIDIKSIIKLLYFRRK